MKTTWHLIPLLVLLSSTSHSGADEPALSNTLLFDFENEMEVKEWSTLSLPNVKLKEPPMEFTRSEQNATSGKNSLKIAFAGGEWPTLITTNVPSDWSAY